MSQFEDDLCELINRHSQENASGTPDFILAEFMMNCLASYNLAVYRREKWYGKSVSGHSIETESIPIPEDVQKAIEKNLGSEPDECT